MNKMTFEINGGMYTLVIGDSDQPAALPDLNRFVNLSVTQRTYPAESVCGCSSCQTHLLPPSVETKAIDRVVWSTMLEPSYARAIASALLSNATHVAKR